MTAADSLPTTASQPMATTASLEGAPSGAHGREGSGRSVLSAVSGTLQEARQRDRNGSFAAIMQRVQRRAHRREADLEAGEGANTTANVDAVAQPTTNPVDTRNTATLLGLPVSNPRQTKKDTKREREEAATLFGPSLAHYFGSGSSSSGAIGGSTGVAINPPVTPGNAPPPTPGPSVIGLPDTPISPHQSLPRPGRLGGRGRLREGSLSGLGHRLSSQNLNLERKRSTSQSSAPFGFSLAETPGLDQNDANHVRSMAYAVAMSEGIDIAVLEAWIQNSLQVCDAAGSDPQDRELLAGASHATSQCTVLESLVNLKRNTLNLMTVKSKLGFAATVGDQNDASVSEDVSGVDHPLSITTQNVVQSSELRPARSLSAMPAYGPMKNEYGLDETHHLHFEYDCTTPQASVQLFLRASRKHGSWENWIQTQKDKGIDPRTTPGASESLYYTHHPPPHVLGWPIHSSVVQHGYGQAVRASLALRLALYAPPASSQSTAHSQNFDEVGSSAPGPSKTLSPTDAAAGDGTYVAPSLAPIPADETKEQRQAREKLERETLKLAIVVEALDSSGQALTTPNLQVTYIRLTSLPVRPPAGGLASASGAVDSDLAVPPVPPTEDSAAVVPSSLPSRVWTAHVEGQEAEIGSHRFQLQELYGLSSRPPAPHLEEPVGVAPGEGDAEDGTRREDGGIDPAAPGEAPPFSVMDMGGDFETGECLICLSSPTTTLLLPCTHGLCLDCSVQLRDSVKSQREAEVARGKMPKKKWNCPMCRRQFTSMLHLSHGTSSRST